MFSSAYALEVTPSKDVVTFESGMAKGVSVHVRNSNEEQVLGKMFVYGEMENYTDFVTQEYLFQPGETKAFRFNILMPEKFEKPGDYRFDFVASEIAIEESTDFISVLTASASIFIVRVPFEGPYLSSRLKATSVSVGELVPFYLKMENTGSVALSNIEGVIDIFNVYNESVGQLSFNDQLELGEIKEIQMKWNPEDNTFGDYWGMSTLNFQGKTSESMANFKLGDVHVSILDYDNDVEVGTINRYYLRVKSDWGNEIDNVVAFLEIYHNPFKSFKSETFRLNSWEERDVLIYVDAEGMSSGKYPARLSLIYDDIHTEEEFDIEVKSFDYSILWVGAGIFIIVFGIGYFILIRIKKKRDGKR